MKNFHFVLPTTLKKIVIHAGWRRLVAFLKALSRSAHHYNQSASVNKATLESSLEEELKSRGSSSDFHLSISGIRTK